MVDTTKLKLSIAPNVIGDFISSEQGFEILQSQLTKIQNCDIISCDPARLTIGVRLSYPRAFANTNAYLVLTKDECTAVQYRFVNNLLALDKYENAEDLKNWFIKHIRISITRVDIPFTYYMGTDEEFNSYRNVYRIMAAVFKTKNNRCIPKNIGTFIEDEIETLILTNTKNVGAYNKKIVFYNQAKKIEDYYSKKPQMYNSIKAEYPDLSSRMRIEVSHRTRIKEKDLIEFSEFDIYGEYVVSFARYALENLSDSDILNSIYSNQIAYLVNLLQQERVKPYFNYRDFILKYKDNIFDYKLLREAIFMIIENSNAKYSASSTVKALLGNLQIETGIIYMDTIERINDIANFLQGIIRGEVNGK